MGLAQGFVYSQSETVTYSALIVTVAALAYLMSTLGRFVLTRVDRHMVLPVWVDFLTLSLSALVTFLTAMGMLPWWWLPVPLVLLWFAVPLLIIDIQHQRLPNVLTLSAIPTFTTLIMAAAIMGPGGELAYRAALGAALFFLLHLTIHLISPSSLGAGDVKLSITVGGIAAAVSWFALLVTTVVAALITAVWGIGRWRSASGIPHGPGMLIATLFVAIVPGEGALAG